MTASQASRYCIVGAVIGFSVGVALQLVFLMVGIQPFPFMKIGLAAGLALIFLGGKAIQERIFRRAYDKEVIARRQRMHW